MTLNDLITTLGSTKDRAVMESVFTRIGEYAKFHFDTEERYFDEFHYAGAAEHKQKHQEFREAFAKISSDYLTDHITASFNLADFLEDWLFDHVMNMDKKYVSCFKEHGLT